MQIAESRKRIAGAIAAGLFLALCFLVLAGSDVHAQTDNEKGSAASEQTSVSILSEQVNDGWQADGTYYRDGALLRGFQTIDGTLYYLDSATGVKKVNIRAFYNGTLYRFGSDGAGALYTGTYNKKYYRNGSLYTGIYKGKRYSKGVLFTGTYNKKYYKAGKRYSGVRGSYYYAKGVKQTRYKNKVRKMNNGKIYYFTKKGKVYKKKGWKRVNGKRYYFKSGAAVTGWKSIGKYKYYFDKKGRLCQDLIAKFGNKWKKKVSLIKVNRKRNCVTLYAKDGKKWIPVKAMACSVGKAGTPTVKGTYYLTKDRTYRWGLLGGPTMGGYVYGQYCSRITGSYLFHSVTYRTRNNRTLVTSAYNNLGGPASHGCIRLQTSNAKIIYDIARNKNTKVVIYDGKSVGPFDKPSVKKIPSGQNYDPTDPNIKKKK